MFKSSFHVQLSCYFFSNGTFETSSPILDTRFIRCVICKYCRQVCAMIRMSQFCMVCAAFSLCVWVCAHARVTVNTNRIVPAFIERLCTLSTESLFTPLLIIN